MDEINKDTGTLITTKQDVLTLEAKNYGTITLHLNATFGFHNIYKSHTGAVMMIGKGCIQPILTKQKVNSRSSTEVELISMDDILFKVMWTKICMQEDGCKIIKKIRFTVTTHVQ